MSRQLLLVKNNTLVALTDPFPPPQSTLILLYYPCAAAAGWMQPGLCVYSVSRSNLLFPPVGGVAELRSAAQRCSPLGSAQVPLPLSIHADPAQAHGVARRLGGGQYPSPNGLGDPVDHGC